MSERIARLTEELWKAVGAEETWETAPEPIHIHKPAPKPRVIKTEQPRREDDALYNPTEDDDIYDDEDSSEQWDESDLSEPARRQVPSKYSQRVQKKGQIKRPRGADFTYKPTGETESSSSEDDSEETGVTKRRKMGASRTGTSHIAQDTAKRRKGQPSHDTNAYAIPAATPGGETTNVEVPEEKEHRERVPRFLVGKETGPYPQSPIPGFADLFTPTWVEMPEPGPREKPNPVSPKKLKPEPHEELKLDSPKKPGAGPHEEPKLDTKIPGPPQELSIWASAPPPSTSQHYATASNGEKIGDSKRDWPPYPGTIYCEPCFRHDCLRAIRLRRDTFLVLNVMGRDTDLAYFILQKTLLTELPPDMMTLVALRMTVSEWKKVDRPQAETQQIDDALERMRQVLNLSGKNSIEHIETTFKPALAQATSKLDQSKLRGVISPPGNDMKPYASKIRRDLYLELGITLPPTLEQQDSLELDKRFLQSIGDSITRALHRISSSTTSTATAPVGRSGSASPFPSILPYLNCSYCLQSGASNKLMAIRKHPRDAGADAARPWTDALQISFPWIYRNSKTKTATTTTNQDSKKTNLITAPRTNLEESIKIKSAAKFLSTLADRNEVEQVTIHGLVFFVLRNDKPSGSGREFRWRPPTPHPNATFFAVPSATTQHDNDEFRPRFVLVEMKTVYDEIANGVWWDQGTGSSKTKEPVHPAILPPVAAS